MGRRGTHGYIFAPRHFDTYGWTILQRALRLM
jgi:hypothetical protein